MDYKDAYEQLKETIFKYELPGFDSLQNMTNKMDEQIKQTEQDNERQRQADEKQQFENLQSKEFAEALGVKEMED